MQLDLFRELLYTFEIYAREPVTCRRYMALDGTGFRYRSYQKTRVVHFIESYNSPSDEAAVARLKADHPNAQILGVQNLGEYDPA